MKRVANGLAVLYYTLAISVLISMAIGVLSAVYYKTPRYQMTQFAWPALFVVVTVLNLIGMWLCLDTPDDSGARNLIRTSLILTLSGLGMSVLRYLLIVPGAFVFPWVGVVHNSLAIVLLHSFIVLTTIALNWSSRIVFVLYLRKLAIYLSERKLVTRARNLLIAGIITAVCIEAIPIAFGIARPSLGKPAADNFYVFFGLAGFGIVILGWYILITYLKLLRDLRTKILTILGSGNSVDPNAY
jgi:hypothetical protein